jgi:glucose/arabinose dehydrogenase
MTNCSSTALLFVVYLVLWACRGTAQDVSLEKIELPPGFEIAMYARDVPGARSMTVGPKGTLFVGTRDHQVYAVVDRDGDQRADVTHTIASGLRSPNGVAVRDGALYVGEIHRIVRFDDIENRLENPPEPAVVYDQLPQDKHHGWKFIAFGPDGMLYVPIGAPCNICEREDPYAGITRMNPDGSGYEVFARGIRNTVGFDWHPQTKVMWLTDNGRDYLGDDQPPDELNRAPKPGMHFGFPHCHGGTIPDPELGKEGVCESYVAPAAALGPHVAALGMRFYTGTMFPAEYRNRIFIAEHGSWNRSKKIGYRVASARVDDGKASDYSTFAAGWLRGQNAWGRPVDVQQMPDGALLVSDDHTGAIYRISYRKP